MISSFIKKETSKCMCLIVKIISKFQYLFIFKV